MRSALALTLLIWLASCASHKIITHRLAGNTALFPPGSYVHQVTIHTKGGKEFSLKGILQLSPQRIEVVGLSAFGTTVFRLKENRKTGAIAIDVFDDSLKKHESHIKKFYGHLRKLLTLSRRASPSPDFTIKSDASGNPVLIQSTDAADPWQGHVLSYDKSGIPDKMSIETKYFKVMISVTEYEI